MNYPKCGITERCWWNVTMLLMVRARERNLRVAYQALTSAAAEEMWLTGSYL